MPRVLWRLRRPPCGDSSTRFGAEACLCQVRVSHGACEKLRRRDALLKQYRLGRQPPGQGQQEPPRGGVAVGAGVDR